MSAVHCEIHGQGKPLVMLHGWAMHSGIWRDFALQLAEHCQVICLDLPGHGRSAAVEPFALAQIATALIQAIPVKRFSVLGWSLGATVAVDMAARFPERVDALMLLAGNPKFVQADDWPGVKAEVLDSFAAQLSGDARMTLQRFLGLQVQGLPDAKQLLQRLRQAIQACDATDQQALKGGLDVLKHSDLRQLVAELQCSISVIQGDKDTLIPTKTAQAVQILNPRVAVDVLKNAGHVPFLSHPQQLCDIILAAL